MIMITIESTKLHNYKMMRLPALPKCVCVLPMLTGGGSQVETAREGKFGRRFILSQVETDPFFLFSLLTIVTPSHHHHNHPHHHHVIISSSKGELFCPISHPSHLPHYCQQALHRWFASRLIKQSLQTKKRKIIVGWSAHENKSKLYHHNLMVWIDGWWVRWPKPHSVT